MKISFSYVNYRVLIFFSFCVHESWTNDHIAYQGPLSMVTSFQITSKIFKFGTWNFTTIAGDIKLLYLQGVFQVVTFWFRYKVFKIVISSHGPWTTVWSGGSSKAVDIFTFSPLNANWMFRSEPLNKPRTCAYSTSQPLEFPIFLLWSKVTTFRNYWPFTTYYNWYIFFVLKAVFLMYVHVYSMLD